MEPSTERPRARRWWTEAEDQILRREAELQLSEGSLKDWNRIAKVLPGRTNKDCRKRWSKVSNQVNKGMWTADEDRRLEAAVNLHGYKWTHVASVVGTRHADQCAKRWRHSLNPDLDRGEWTPEDDKALLASVAASGRNWKAIGQRRFPARSTTDIKNRFVILERRRRHTVGPSFTSGRYQSPSPSTTNNIPTTFRTPQITLHTRATSCSMPRNAFSPSPSPSDSLDVDAFSENFTGNPHSTTDHSFLQRPSDPTGIGLWIPDMPTWPHFSHSMSEPTSSTEDILHPLPFSIASTEYTTIPAAQAPPTSSPATLPPSLSPNPIILDTTDTLGAWPESLALDDPATGSPLVMPTTCGADFTQLPPTAMSAMQVPSWMNAGRRVTQFPPSYDRGPFYSVRRH